MMSTLAKLTAFLAVLTLGCTEPAPPKIVTSRGAAPRSPDGPSPPPPQQRLLDAKTACSEDAFLLTQYSYANLQAGGYCKLCRAFDENACDLDWPFSDVPSCKAYDEIRNGIFAFYGRTFESEEWRAFFAAKPWYKPDPAFTEERLSNVARSNVAYLKRAATEKIGCAD